MRGKIIVLFGLLLMLAGLLWYAVALREDNDAARAAQELVPQLQQAIVEQSVSDSEPEETQTQQLRMSEINVDGIGYVGVLEIPILSLELPVINFWTSDNGKIAPCRYAGSVYEDDLILCAHNYDSHFGKLKKLSVGDAVEFTDIDGNRFSYQMCETLIVDGTDFELLHNGDWDLTLFTCTPGGKMRYCVRCRLLPK